MFEEKVTHFLYFSSNCWFTSSKFISNKSNRPLVSKILYSNVEHLLNGEWLFSNIFPSKTMWVEEIFQDSGHTKVSAEIMIWILCNGWEIIWKWNWNSSKFFSKDVILWRSTCLSWMVFCWWQHKKAKKNRELSSTSNISSNERQVEFFSVVNLSSSLFWHMYALYTLETIEKVPEFKYSC